MSPHLHWPRLHRRRRDAHASAGRAPMLVSGVILLSVLASAAQVAGLALPRDDVGVTQAVAPDAVPEADDAPVVVPVDLVELPPASVDAIRL